MRFLAQCVVKHLDVEEAAAWRGKRVLIVMTKN